MKASVFISTRVNSQQSRLRGLSRVNDGQTDDSNGIADHIVIDDESIPFALFAFVTRRSFLSFSVPVRTESTHERAN
jgi:hypothetical protein